MSKRSFDGVKLQIAALRHNFYAYLFAFCLSALALLAKQEIAGVFAHGRYFLHMAVVVFVSLYGGIGPGLVAILVSVLGSTYFFLEPLHSFRIEKSADSLLLVMFTLVSLLICLVAAKLRQGQRITGESRKKAEQAVSARLELLAVVSHDLKNPITAILLNSRLLIKLVNSSSINMAAVCRQIEHIETAAEQMKRLIQDILDMETIESGELKLETTSEDLQPLLLTIQDLFEPIAREKCIQLIVHHLSVPVRVRCDKTRIVQVFSNLIGNALKFTASGGTIEIKTKLLAEGQVQISVRDTGPGIRPENQGKVFGHHWQEASTSRLGQGLGLHIAKGIVDAHKGRLWLESVFGQGSTFYFTLPLQAKADSFVEEDKKVEGG